MLRVGPTDYGGRAYFATNFIPAHTLILTDSPSVACTLDDFKKEVCVSCFHYNNGSTLPVKIGSSRACSAQCLATTQTHAQDNVQGLRVQDMWDTVQARRRELERRGTYIDLLRFCVAALPLFCHPENKEQAKTCQDFMALQDDSALWTETERDSAAGVTEALNLLFPHLALTTTTSVKDFVTAVSGRSKCNAFGIWQQQADGTSFPESEMLGFAVYVKSSYFNHSCAPNVEKKRIGRNMQFCTLRDVQAGEELVISYLGDREYKDVQERREALRGWGFECVCTLCKNEMAL